jgi:hypothetical protein
MRQSKFKAWVNSEVEKKLDQVRFPQLPIKMRIGIILLTISFSVGYGVTFLVLLISGFKHKFSIGLIRGSIFYIASWPIGAIGLALAGKDCIKYPIYFFAKFIKKIFPSYFG